MGVKDQSIPSVRPKENRLTFTTNLKYKIYVSMLWHEHIIYIDKKTAYLTYHDMWRIWFLKWSNYLDGNKWFGEAFEK